MAVVDVAERALRSDDAHRVWWRRFPLWFPLAVYAVTRAFNALVYYLAQRDQIALPASNGILRIMFPTPKAPGYTTVLGNWDGQWYQQIATYGYPTELPYTYQGLVDMNPWAFYPLYPFLVRGGMAVTGLDFHLVASTLALLFGAVAMVLLFRLVDQALGRWYAVGAVVGTCTFISAPVMQATYTESLALLLIVTVLLLLRARRYLWVAVALVALALTRNVVMAMAPVMAAHFVVRWANRENDPFPMRQRVGLAALAAQSAALTFLWPTIIEWVTGVPDAYAKTMWAWRINANELKLIYWWDYLWYGWGVFGVLFGIGAVVVFAWLMLTHRTWRWGPELWGWAGAYPAYQVLVTNTGPSRLRYALLAFPFAVLIAWFINLKWWHRYRVHLLIGVAVIGLGLQVYWISDYFIVSHLDGRVNYP